ncbi:MAG: helix-turn-helix transcriptional regulator [Kiritimatiellae bacterium]|nr:helix-turn-helix transcriptional regulator [Kiritimatiellia bacterium]MDD5519716.1 helix-turn-helix transcriptional regulator [Kiritimatiellia bacterium]
MSTWLERISPCIRPMLPGESVPSYVSHLPAPQRWIEPLRVIYDHELVMFTHADFVTEITGKKYCCPRNSFIIVPPGRWHVSYNADNRAGHRYWAHFDWCYHGPYRPPAPIITFHPAKPKVHLYRYAPRFVPGEILHGPITNMKRALEIHERLTMMQSYGNAHEKFVSRAVLLELLLELLDTRSRKEGAFGEEAELASRVRDSLEHAMWNLPKMPPIQELLGNLGYSYAHLCRLFRARYGIAPLKYIHALQITRAKMLLQDTNLSIAEIGYRVGFDNPAYFTLLFRKMTGATPSDYKYAGKRKR